jgi:hypothetical protein
MKMAEKVGTRDRLMTGRHWDENHFLLQEEQAPKRNVWELQASFPLAIGDIYWERGTGKRTKLIHAGAVIDSKQLEKFKTHPEQFSLEPILNLEHIEIGRKALRALASASKRKAHKQEALEEARVALLQWIRLAYWEEMSDRSLMDWAYLWHQEFFNLKMSDLCPAAQGEYMQRACMQGALIGVLALTLGFNDYSLLSDLYTMAFIADSGISKENWSFNIVQAIELEREKSGAGAKVLNLVNEKEVFLNHSLKAKMPSLNYPLLIKKLVSRHHEKVEGGGFPLCSNRREMDDLEIISSFGLTSLSFDWSGFSSSDGGGWLRRLVRGIASRRVVAAIGFTFNPIVDDGYKEIIGL